MPPTGKPPTAALPGGTQATSTAALPWTVFSARSTLAWSFFGAPGSGQRGVEANVSASDAQVSNTTGAALPFSAGAANCVNSCQTNASEFSVLPSTAPARAGTATTTLCAVAPAAQNSRPIIVNVFMHRCIAHLLCEGTWRSRFRITADRDRARRLLAAGACAGRVGPMSRAGPVLSGPAIDAAAAARPFLAAMPLRVRVALSAAASP
ncbi:MAG: hypothetical protein NVV68_01030 [Dokdonella sp.]|nr:hypothetical protein [Dokdonella sp.]